MRYAGFAMIALVLFASVLLFGCAQQPAQRNETANVTVPVVNESGTEQPVNETKPVVQPPAPVVEARKASVGIGFSSVASNPIGKGLAALNVTVGRIEAHGANGWIVLSDDVKTIDLVEANGNRIYGASASVPLGSYDKIRLNIIKAEETYTSVAAIPGVLVQRETRQLSISSNVQEIASKLEMSDEKETYSVTVQFDIDSIDPAAVSAFEPSLTASLKTRSACGDECTNYCETTSDQYKECFGSCRLDEIRNCDMAASSKCMVDCGCPNNRCPDTSTELCKVDCLNREKSDNSTCMMAVNSTCVGECESQSFFILCSDQCMENC